MKLTLILVTLLMSFQSLAGWRSDARKQLKEYKYACKSAEVSIDSIVANDSIKGHVKGLPTEALDKFKVVFYVKTNYWYIHPYMYYEGQEEGYSYSNLNSNGEFKIKTVRRAVPAKELAAVVVPKSYKIRSKKFWKKPILGFIGGVLNFQCTSKVIPGNGDF